MSMLNLCIDIDGTVTKHYYWLQRANTHFNTKIETKDVTVYEIHEVLGIEEAAYDKFYNAYGELLHKEAEIRFGAKEIISLLYDFHQIHFVTAREEKMRQRS